jgi:hypothetical protein
MRLQRIYWLIIDNPIAALLFLVGLGILAGVLYVIFGR